MPHRSNHVLGRRRNMPNQKFLGDSDWLGMALGKYFGHKGSSGLVMVMIIDRALKEITKIARRDL